MGTAAGGRRRIDRVTAPDFLDGIADRPVAVVRAMRDECREEETQLSFARRLLQARLDIVRAVVARRGDERAGDPDQEFWKGLPEILADQPTRTPDIGAAHVAPIYEPDLGGSRRNDDSLALDATIGRVLDLDDAELVALVQRLSDEERRISDLRRSVLSTLDALQAELVRRYATDSSAISDVVSSAVANQRLQNGT